MSSIRIVNRDMRPTEFTRMKAGFQEHTLEKGVEVQTADRFGFVAMDDATFIGCSSCLVYKNRKNYSGWAYLTDLFVERAYRSQGIGAELLKQLEVEIADLGVKHIWTWTAGYEAPPFYLKQGYEIFTEMEDWYSDGSSRVGLRKGIGRV